MQTDLWNQRLRGFDKWIKSLCQHPLYKHFHGRNSSLNLLMIWLKNTCYQARKYLGIHVIPSLDCILKIHEKNKLTFTTEFHEEKKKNLIKLWSSGLFFFLLLNYNIYNRTASFQSKVLASCFKLPFNVTNKHWWNMRKFKEKAWIVMKFKSVFVTSNIDTSIQFCHWPLQGVIMCLWGLFRRYSA